MVTVRFNADVTADMPWKFTPSQGQVKVGLDVGSENEKPMLIINDLSGSSG